MEYDIMLIDNICRTCLKEGSNLKSLMCKLDEDGRTICEMLSYLVNADICINDKYPKQVCETCQDNLLKANEFKKRCLQSETVLKVCFGRTELSTQVKNENIASSNSDNDFHQCVRCFVKFSDGHALENHVGCHHTVKLEGNKGLASSSQIICETAAPKKYSEESHKTEENPLLALKQETVDFEDDDLGMVFHDDLSYSPKNCEPNCELEIEIPNFDDNVKETKEKIKNETKHVCDICKKSFYSKQGMLKHKDIHKHAHRKYDYHCSLCTRKFKKKSSLVSHLKTHEDREKIRFMCPTCRREFQHQAHLDKHILSVHGKKVEFACDRCSKWFSTQKNLEFHVESHKIEKRHQCKTCGKAFYMLSTLTDHLRTHTGEKPYLCSVCGKGFSQKTNLQQHTKRHFGEKKFKCEQCERGFVSKGELQAHTRKHSGAHPFICDDCGNGFTTSSSLVKHRRTHTGERPYACDLCPMKFSVSGTLKNHRRTHTGEKPYQCSHCEKAFIQRQDLISHIRCHTGERPYTCNVCGQAFRKTAALKAHIKIHG